MDDIVIEFPRRVFRGGRRWSRAQRTMAVSWVAGIAAVAALLPLAVGGGPRDDVQVVANATTEGSQSAPAIATLPGGKVVVVWEGAGPGDTAGVFARIRDAATGFGTEILVNEVTEGTQGEAAVAADSTGNFLVAWSGPSAAEGGAKDVFTRLFDATGSPLRGEEVLNLHTGGDQSNPAVTAVGVGRFAVAFQGSGAELLVVPAPVSPPAPVEPPVAPPEEPPIEPPVEPPVEPPSVEPPVEVPPLVESPVEPPVEVLQAEEPAPPPEDPAQPEEPAPPPEEPAPPPEEPAPPPEEPAPPPEEPAPPPEEPAPPPEEPAPPPDPVSDSQGIFLRYTGQTTDPEQVWVNSSHADGDQQDPAVAASGSTVMVVWSGAGSDDPEGIYATTVSGLVANPEAFRVNTTIAGLQGEPVVVARAANDFVAVWSGAGALDGNGVYFAPLDRSTGEIAVEVLVNSTTAGAQRHPAAAVSGTGVVTVAWDGAGGVDTSGVHARRFDPRVNLQPVTTEIAVNTTTDGQQRHPAVAGNSQGDYTVAFQGPGDDSDVFVRRFAVNDAPDVTADAYTVEEDNILSGDVLANDVDVDGDRLTASTTENPANGVLDLREDGTFDYTPTANFNGQDRFSYRADDGDLKSTGPAEVVITIQSVNDGGPTAVPDGPYSATEDTQLVVSDPSKGLLGNDNATDPDGDTLTASLKDQPGSGAVTISPDGTFTYLPTADFCGKDQFTYVASDGTIESAPGEAKIEVSCVVDAPRGGNDQYFTAEDIELAVPAPGVLENDYREPDRGVSARLQEGTKSGTLAFNEDGSFTYRPNQDFNGEDSFTYYAVDKAPPPSSSPPPAGPLAPVAPLLGESEPPGDPPPEPAPGPGQVAQVTITVGAAEDTPVASDDAYFTPLDTELAVSADKGLLANDTDPDEGDLTVRLAAPPTRGKMVVFNPDGSFTYQPNPGFNGTELFTYEVSNQSGKTSTGRVLILVGDQGGRIIATADRYQLQEDVSLTVSAPGVLANDVDPDGDKLALSVVTGVTHGTLEINQDGSLLYAPAPDFTGTDRFTYQVKDPEGHAATAEVTIVVRPVDEAKPDVDPTTETGPPAPTPPAPPPPPPPPPPVEIKPVTPPQPASTPEDLAAPVVPITVPTDGGGSVAPVAPPTVAVLPPEADKGLKVPVRPLAAAGGGGLALAGLLAGLRSRRRMALGQVEDLPID